MKGIVRFALLGLAVAAVGALLLWSYLSHREEAAGEAAEEAIGGAASVSRTPAGDPVVKLDGDAQKRVELKTEPVVEISRPQEEPAYGRLEEDPLRSFTLRAPAAGTVRLPRNVQWPDIGQTLADGSAVGIIEPRLAPADRVTLGDRLASAKADAAAGKTALAAAQAALNRTRILNADDKNLSDRAVQEAEAKVAAEQARVDAAAQSVSLIESALNSTAAGAALPLELERGGEVVEVLAHPGESVESGQPVLRVARFDNLLARVDLPAGVPIASAIQSARIVPIGYAGGPIRATRVAISSAIDPRTQGQSLLFRIVGAPPTLRPGLSVTAWLEKPGAVRRGSVVSRASVVRQSGKAWVYVQTAADSFTRREIVLEEPTAEGWFTRSLARGDRVVTTGAQTLLSEELKSQIQVGEESQP